ncbi:MAG: gephyrin-like molybdotransferase Glp [Rhodospirillaceae bacterium]
MSLMTCPCSPDDKPARLGVILPVLLEAVTPITETESVPLASALGRSLAEPVITSADVPPLNNAAMDGYAFAVEYLRPEHDTTLPVFARIAAGHPLTAMLPPGHAVRIFTGAAMPAGADTVATQEQCRAGAGTVTVPAGIVRGANVRRAGDDLARGSVALPAGRRLRPADLGLAAAAGAPRLTVYRQLRVAVFSTGDELREPGQGGAPGTLHDSNRYTLLGLLEQAGCKTTDLGILPDRPEVITETMLRAANNHDAVITSGGMSVGDEDHIRAALTAAGGRIDHWRLAIKPGKPVGIGTLGRVLFLGLPGNPAAVVVTFLLVARPLLLRLAGSNDEDWPRVHAMANFSYTRTPGRREYLAADLRQDGDSGALVVLRGKQGSHILSGLAAADALVELPENCGIVRPGDPVTVLPLFMP